ncbi:hypothetical protein B296_00033488 [Ensete ventricosum]|uniref:IBB domain-containing protein n=1 Tax=Ensete ventricosum TaxID=4639 RepID=A0A427AAP1_ENSVE|nr:hypothetical protein B296_00033488 [Ensete ventricosum]
MTTPTTHGTPRCDRTVRSSHPARTDRQPRAFLTTPPFRALDGRDGGGDGGGSESRDGIAVLGTAPQASGASIVAVDAEEARWRREDVLVEIRKSKREENLAKKRCEAGPHHLAPPPPHACGMKVLVLAALSFVLRLYCCFARDDRTLSTMLSRS